MLNKFIKTEANKTGSKKYPPLWYALTNLHVSYRAKIVDRLLDEFGADPNFRTKLGCTLTTMYFNEREVSSELLKLLLKYGGKLELDFMQVKYGFQVEMLHSLEFDFTTQDSRGNTLLHLIAYQPYTESFEERHFRIMWVAHHIRNSEGKTPIDIAIDTSRTTRYGRDPHGVLAYHAKMSR